IGEDVEPGRLKLVMMSQEIENQMQRVAADKSDEKRTAQDEGQGKKHGKQLVGMKHQWQPKQLSPLCVALDNAFGLTHIIDWGSAVNARATHTGSDSV